MARTHRPAIVASVEGLDLPRRRWPRALAALAAALLVAATLFGCATPVAPAATSTSDAQVVAPVSTAARDAGAAAARPGAGGRVAGRSDAVAIYLPAAGDTLSAIAERLLGSADKAWWIAYANPQRAALLNGAAAGPALVVPLASPPAYGVTDAGIQTVPVLCYHRFGGAQSKMTMPTARFEAQLQWLAHAGYRVVSLEQVQAFLEGREALPQRSVAITVDDGFESFYRLAFPLVKQYGVRVTLFVYTDIVGTRDGLSWAQLREMAASGLVDIQAHSKTHRNLNERAAGESDSAYRQALVNELRVARALIERQLAGSNVKVRYFAYPYGESNDLVLEALAREGYALAFTVHAGGNPFYAAPHLLRRTMIFGDYGLEEFKARLQTQRALSKP